MDAGQEPDQWHLAGSIVMRSLPNSGQCQSNIPLFLYGVPNRDKAPLTTIMLSYFHLHKLQFESIIVFEDQAEIPRADLARLSDVGGDMISSLNAADDLARKLEQRAA